MDIHQKLVRARRMTRRHSDPAKGARILASTNEAKAQGETEVRGGLGEAEEKVEARGQGGSGRLRLSRTIGVFRTMGH